MNEARQALYVDSLQADRVSLEAVALRVETHHHTTSFFPLRRIARVVVTGKVQWEMEALFACLDYGVAVSFRERDGRLIGHCLSERTNQTALEQLLMACADDPFGDTLYQQWRCQEEFQWVQRAGRTRQFVLPGRLAYQVLGQVERWVQAQLPCRFAQFKAQLQAPIASHVTEVLAVYGFSDNIHVPNSSRVALVRDLIHLLLLEAYWLVLRGQRPVLVAQRGLRYSVVSFYEEHQAHFEERARIALNRLWRQLKCLEVDAHD
jgi:hypothetical protein